EGGCRDRPERRPTEQLNDRRRTGQARKICLSLRRVQPAPTMRVISGEPPAKDMGMQTRRAAGCGDRPERRPTEHTIGQ
ncbi:hypothetical protein RZS08_51265, partial [Arthrospira platensis SPKY1]|nr:hypothetical protein [Arthrospira platensis SPKY1]